MNAITAAFHTLGCKTNHYETDAIRMQFQKAGFKITNFNETADIYILNTCTVTGEADRKSRQFLRRARRDNQAAVLVALGCAIELGLDQDGINVGIGTKNKSQTLETVLAYIKNSRPDLAARLKRMDIDTFERSDVGQTADDLHEAKPIASSEAETSTALFDEWGSVSEQTETRAYIKIEDGCDYTCSYCAIPLARGSVRSRQPEKIIAEARALADAGYKEIVLTGIHICSYGKEWQQPGEHLMTLALALADIESLVRIRLGSIEPSSVTDEWIRLAAANKKLCPHFHLSLQSGCDSVLARMGRRYTTSLYRHVVQKLRLTFDQPAITTDIIVGFPGETEAEHQTSMAFCEEICLSRMHVFKYSRRAGTRAAGMKNQIPGQIINRRATEMGELAERLMTRYHKERLGSSMQIILEKRITEHQYSGYSERYIPVLVDTKENWQSGCLIEATARKIYQQSVHCDNAICVDP